MGTEKIDTLVVGAGVVGLACARAVAMTGREVVVVDRHAAPGMETSSRNSEVIHAGIYYPAGSLKAAMCISGRDALYRYAQERCIAHRRCGKLIVSQGASAEADLARIAARAEAAGAGALTRLTKSDVKAMEGNVRADAALFSSFTGIIDSHQVMLHYLADLEDQGGIFAPCTEIRRVARHGAGFAVSLADSSEVITQRIVNAAGLSSGAVARMIDALPEAFKPAIRFARGAYFRPSKSPGFTHLVYPLPTNASLGVHATIDLSGQARFGPDVEWTDDPDDYSIDPARGEKFREAIQEYWPAVDDVELVPDYVGIRPKLVGPGDPPADFRIDGPRDHGVPGLICLHGIESPGLTASLALGGYVSKRLFEPPLAP